MTRIRSVHGLFHRLLVLGVSALVLTACDKQEVKTPPPAEVNVVTVTPTTIPVNVSFVAQVESAHQVEIVARVNGFLDKILYTEGEVVQQGQDMFLMDQKPFIAQVEAARASLANHRAQLWTAQANLDRIKPLAELDAASKSDRDNAIGAAQSAEAALHQAEARLEQAELDLSYTEIKSPVNGVSGELHRSHVQRRYGYFSDQGGTGQSGCIITAGYVRKGRDGRCKTS